MNENFKEILVSLLERVSTIAATQTWVIRHMIAERELTENCIKTAVDASIMIGRIDDPERQKQALEEVWKSIGFGTSTGEMKDVISRIETSQERTEAVIRDLIENLNS